MKFDDKDSFTAPAFDLSAGEAQAVSLTVEAPSAFVPSPEQAAVIAEGPSGRRNVIVQARAGSGKTTTAKHFLAAAREPSRRRIYVAFNRSVIKEAKAKLSAYAEIKSFHGLGYAFIRRRPEFKNCKPDNGVEKLRLRDALKVPAYRTMGDAPEADILACVSRAKNTLPFAKSAADLLPAWDAAGCEISATQAERGWTDQVCCRVAWAMMEAAKRPNALQQISFDDQVWLPVAMGWCQAWWDLVVADEAQDLNATQWELVRRACSRGGRIVLIGDDRQCHPPGVLVRTPDGEVPIEQLNNGDTVTPYSRNAQRMVGRRAIKVAQRQYDGLVHDVESNDRTVPATSNHKFLCRWTDRTSDVCVVYLMWRADLGFRVGWCKLFTSSQNGRCHIFHLAERARIEKADRTWVLSVHQSRTSASITESEISVRFGIPTSTFEPVHGAAHLTREAIAEIFARCDRTERGGDNHSNGVAALVSHGRDFGLPLYPWPNQGAGSPQGRRTYFECHAANLLPGLMSLPSPDGQNEWHTISSVSNRPYSGPVYSMDVEQDHSYSANGIVVLNCIYEFRGSVPNGLFTFGKEINATVLPLTVTRRCPKAHVRLAQRLVPDFQAHEDAPEGEILELAGNLLVDRALPGDAVLARTNAPLVAGCLTFLRAGKRAYVEGRDIGAELVGRAKKLRGSTPVEFITSARAWATKAAEKAQASNKDESAVERILDIAETLVVVAEECDTVAEIHSRLLSLFANSDDDVAPPPSVVFSTVHRAKGREWYSVYLLRDSWRKLDFSTEVNQDTNLLYVASTRSKRTLTWVDGQVVRQKSAKVAS